MGSRRGGREKASGFPIRFSETQLSMLRLVAAWMLYEREDANVRALLDLIPPWPEKAAVTSRSDKIVRIPGRLVCAAKRLCERCLELSAQGVGAGHTALAIQKRLDALGRISAVDMIGDMGREP